MEKKKVILVAAIAAAVAFVLGIATGTIATPTKTTTTERIVEVEKVVEVEVPVQVEVPVEVEVEKIVEIEIPVEIEKTVEVETIIEVEKPVEVERVIEVEKIVEIEKIIEIEKIVEVPVEPKKIFTSNPQEVKPGYTYYVSSVLHQYPSIYGFVGFGQKNEFIVDFDALVKAGLNPYSTEYGFEITVTSTYSHTSKKDVWNCVVHAVYELETKEGQKIADKKII